MARPLTRNGLPRNGNFLGRLQSEYSLHPVAVMVALGLLGLSGVFHLYNSSHNSYQPEHRQSLLNLHKSDTKQKLRDPGDMIPVDCPGYLKQHLAGKLDDPNKGVVHAAQVPRGNDHHPNFFISLHSQEFDHTRWVIMDKRDYYEKAVTAAFIEVLNDPKATRPQRVIDVGGNIGFFTHLSAANGPVIVDAFEPNDKNRLRFCESLQLNQWTSEFEEDTPAAFAQESHVNLYDYGVGKDPGYFNFKAHPNNPGQGRFVRRSANADDKGTRVINLDQLARTRGWFESRPDIAILKVDVEGLDPFVIEGASVLLQAKLVRHVFMEISVAPTGKDMKDAIGINKVALKLLFRSGYELYKVGGWIGPDKLVDFSKEKIGNTNDIDAKTDRIIEWAQRERAKQLNLWWKLPTAR